MQAKLSVGQPNDAYEKEADATADQVVHRLDNPGSASENGNHGPSGHPAPTISRLVQKKCAACEQEEKLQKAEEAIQTKAIFESNEKEVQRKCAECEKEEQLQKKSAPGAAAEPSSNVESYLSASKGQGSPLPMPVRSGMESAMGADFGDVRIHNDSSSHEASNQLNAQAFTHGGDIYFNQGKYDTDSEKGKHLLAHELTHVVQQGSSRGMINRDELKPEDKKNEEIYEYTKTANDSSKQIQGTPAGKQLARDAIGKWKTGEPAAILTYDAKMNIIRELLTKNLSADDQSKILDLIELSEVVYVKQFIKESEINSGISSYFNDANKQRYEAIKIGRAKEKDTSGESFRVANVRDLVDEAHANALLEHDAAGRQACIGTVRHISIANLYKHLPADEQKRMKKIIDKECATNNTMLDAMTGMEKAKYAEKTGTATFKKRKEVLTNLTLDGGKTTIKYTTWGFPDTLKESVWSMIDKETKGKEGWHSFGLAIMDSFHSVVLLVNVRPGGPFLYFVDQTNRQGGADPGIPGRLASTLPGTQQFTPGGLDAYLAYYAGLNFEGYIQGNIDKKKTGSVTEKDISKMEPDTQMDLWHLKKEKIKE